MTVRVKVRAAVAATMSASVERLAMDTGPPSPRGYGGLQKVGATAGVAWRHTSTVPRWAHAPQPMPTATVYENATPIGACRMGAAGCRQQ